MDMNLENQMWRDRPQGHGEQSYESVVVLGVGEGAPVCLLTSHLPPPLHLETLA